MIWFFPAGMIAGAVGMVMFAGWWIRKHIRKVTEEEMEYELCKVRTAEGDDAGCDEGRKVPEPDQRDDSGYRNVGPASEQCVADKRQGESTGKS